MCRMPHPSLIIFLIQSKMSEYIQPKIVTIEIESEMALASSTVMMIMDEDANDELDAL